MDLKQGHAPLIVSECLKRGLLRNQAAYVLATAYHETAHTMKPVREYGGEAYLKKKPYYPYVGMGFVQLTWLANYKKASVALGVDFVKYPKTLLEPGFSATILVIGMRDGWFTGKKLADYVTFAKSDFVGARRIVNGTDRAALIAGYAKQYDAALKASGYGEVIAPEPSVSKPSSPETPVLGIAPKGGFLASLLKFLASLLPRKGS